MFFPAIFSPAGSSGTVLLGLTTVSTLGGAVLMGNVQSQSVRVYNASTGTAWIAFGSSTIVASTAGSMPIGGGITDIFRPNGNSLYAAGLVSTATVTGTLYLTPGSGAQGN